MEDVDLPLQIKGMRIGTELDDDNSTEADSTLLADLKEANDACAELEAQTPVTELDANESIAELDASEPIAELDASHSIVELPAESKMTGRKYSSSTRKRYELEA